MGQIPERQDREEERDMYRIGAQRDGQKRVTQREKMGQKGMERDRKDEISA